MALGRYTEVARAANGDLIRAGRVAVLAAGTVDLVDLFADEAGEVPLSNPVATDLTGAWSAVAEAGLYDVAYPDGRIVRNVPILAPAGEAPEPGLSAGDISAVAPVTWDEETATIGVTTGTTAGTVAAGNHTHPGLTADQAAGTASVRTLGTGAQQAAAGSHSHGGLMTGSAMAVPDSEATDAAALLADFNALLAALRTRGIIT
ncbi:hypothetical protein RM844_28715 [Streptomyces sp. DSM 44915]|uniref:Uncharacterized protein n=1 Tax=Streptomyces chisholmiae TaxID=3075540 RepID=A0ABU2JZ78_9ACTN|nr:hypothetical protein [Streptomyces sp. DSM 44915]MDT0270260.1 hypothetical protein [Streptomyces sp. DSM 44915]